MINEARITRKLRKNYTPEQDLSTNGKIQENFKKITEQKEFYPDISIPKPELPEIKDETV